MVPAPPHAVPVASQCSPVAPDWVMMADMGMVLMMVVVPGLVVLGETLLMPRMVGLGGAPPACVVLRMVGGFPSADVTSFRMVPAGSGPLVCGERGALIGGGWGRKGLIGGFGERMGLIGGLEKG